MGVAGRAFHVVIAAACLSSIVASAAERPDPLAYHAVLYKAGPSWVKGRAIQAQPGIQAHGAYMAKQSSEGRIVFGGPFIESRDPGSLTGALLVWATDSAEEARRLAEADPGVQGGLLAITEVQRIGVLAGAWRPWTLPATGAAPAPAAGTSDVEAEIRRLEERWAEATRRRERAALETILAPDFTFTAAVAGRPLTVVSRSDWLGAVEGVYTVESFAFDDLQVRVLGDTAVASARCTLKATLAGRDRSGEFFQTDVWAKRDGRWQAVSRLSSRPEPPQ